MNNNNTPAHLITNLKVTPHDSFYKSRTPQNEKVTATAAATTATTIPTTTTNDCTMFSASSARSRLETLELCLTQENEEDDEEEEEKEQHEKKNTSLQRGERRGEQQVVSTSYKSSCKQISSNNDKKSVHIHNTSVAINLPLAPITGTRSTLWWWCGLRPSAAACITLLILSTTCSLCSASLCESQSWWDPYKDKCIPCTVCQGDMIPLRPCQMHRDTVCGSIYDLKIDWVVLSKTEPNWKERRKFDGLDYGLDHHQLTAEQLQQLQDETDPMDWQTAALFLAVLACLLFFIVAACILVHHMRQWRRMERRLDQDVEELSTKLMAKLAEVQSLEGGTFFIGNADALRIPTAATITATPTFHQPHHVMLPEKSDKHQQHLHHDRRFFSNTTTLKSGNVYIEENSSKC